MRVFNSNVLYFDDRGRGERGYACVRLFREARSSSVQGTEVLHVLLLHPVAHGGRSHP